MRTLLRSLLRLVLRIFFSRIEVTGIERVPREGPVIFVLNHPNGLIDPAFLLCLAPRRVSFLAKAPLFRMPVIGAIARAFEAIPVHRRQDAGSDLAKNAQTFEAARAVLVRGGTIAVFPEGGSHSDPKLRPLKTGTARIALGAAAALPPNMTIEIVPAGLYYRAKKTFRSAALLHFGDPLPVERIPLAAGAEPPPEPVLQLTERLGSALRAVTLEAEEGEVHALVARAQRVFSAADEAPHPPVPLADEFELRRRLLAGYEVARQRWPARAAELRVVACPHVCREKHPLPDDRVAGGAARSGGELSGVSCGRLGRDRDYQRCGGCTRDGEAGRRHAAVPHHLDGDRLRGVVVARSLGRRAGGAGTAAIGIRRAALCRTARSPDWRDTCLDHLPVSAPCIPPPDRRATSHTGRDPRIGPRSRHCCDALARSSVQEHF